MKKKLSHSWSGNLDFWGFLASFLCAIHCLAIPVLFSIGLLSSLAWLHHPLLEWGFISIAFMIAVPAFYRGYRQHLRQLPLWLAISGLLLLCLGRILPADEHLLTAAAGSLVAAAHWFNWKYQKQQASSVAIHKDGPSGEQILQIEQADCTSCY